MRKGEKKREREKKKRERKRKKKKQREREREERVIKHTKKMHEVILKRHNNEQSK
jgi:hypothetical protein